MNKNIQAGSDIHAGDGGYSEGIKEGYDAFVKVRNKSLVQARIRLLAEQANLKEIIDDAYLERNDWQPFVEKFAELIVKECAEICLEANDYKNILRHFGVEE